MKKKFLLIIIVISFMLIGLISVRALFHKDYNIDGYNLHYYSNMYKYDIYTKNNFIFVEKKIMSICFAPCDEEVMNKYKLNINDEYASFFKSVFSDGNMEKNLSKGNFTEENYDVLQKIIKESNKLTYKILDGASYSSYKARGYYVLDVDHRSKIVIASGEKPSGGYRIQIVNVKISGKDVTIYVKESSKEANTTMALTQPVAMIEFSEKPDRIVVKNVETEEEFYKIN